MIEPPNVTEWPLWARRAFVLTLPLSGVIWLTWLAAYLAGWVVIGLGAMILIAGAWAVTPIVAPLLWLYDTARDLWHRYDEGEPG